jgi:hypothetical protein
MTTTKPATKINGPWPSVVAVAASRRAGPKKSMAVAKLVNREWAGNTVKVEELAITSDPIPDARSLPVSKYDALFRQLEVGQCVVCEPDSAPKVKAGLDKWLKNHGMKHLTSKAMSRYPTDGKGRVWLIEKGK